MDPWHYCDVATLSDRELFALEPLALGGCFAASELSPIIRNAQDRDRDYARAMASALKAITAFYA
jgi:hypothetical protein